MTTKKKTAKKKPVKKRLSEKSIAAIRRMIAGVIAEPQYLNQNNFPQAEDGGTTCCGAGQAVFQKLGLEKYRELVASVEDPQNDIRWVPLGLEALYLPETTPVRTLFDYAHHWPVEFAAMYGRARGPKERALAFKARWEHFIKHDGEGLL